jgi:hypothetical protein
MCMTPDGAFGPGPTCRLQGTFDQQCPFGGYRAPFPARRADMEATMNSLIYLVGLIVVVLFILSFFGLR